MIYRIRALFVANIFTYIPKNYHDLQYHPSYWKIAIEYGVKSFIMKNKTWGICECSDGIQPLSSQWVFKIKPDIDGNGVKYEAHFIARGRNII